MLRLTSIIVPSLFSHHMQSGNANNAAAVAVEAAYHSISEDIFRYAVTISHLKRDISEDRHKFAHPVISQEFLDLFLDNLGAREPHLTPLEVRLFDHLRATSTTIQRSRPKISANELSEKVKN